MGWLLRLILLVVVLYAVWRLISGIIEGAREPRAMPKGNVSLVRDPVCGTYVVPSSALAVGSGREARYFCSERCRRAYLQRN